MYLYFLIGAEEEGKKFLTEIIKGAQLKLSLCGYAEDGIPLIKLFLTNNIYQVIDLSIYQNRSKQIIYKLYN